MADAFDGEKIVDTLKRAVGFACVEDFLRRGWADAGNRFEFGSGGGIEIDGMCGGLLFCGRWQESGEVEGKYAADERRSDSRQLHGQDNARMTLINQ